MVYGPNSYNIRLSDYFSEHTETFYIKVNAKSNNGDRYIWTTAMTM